MNSFSKTNGPSARPKTINKKIKELILIAWTHIQRSISLVLIVATLATLSSCDKNTDRQSVLGKSDDQAMVTNDSLNKPKVNVQVNKRYDEKGNLIGFDSTYSSFYSNVKGDTVKMDSLINSFDRYFNSNHSFSFDRQFNPLFFNDSLRYPDFFHKDFFMRRYELNDEYLRETMERMDSIKNHFFSEHSKKWKDSKDL